MAKKKWMKSAIDPAHKGDFKAKAKAAGESTRAFAKEHEHSPGLLGKQARLATTLMGANHSHKLYSKKG